MSCNYDHYHVGQGMPGCLFDNIAAFTSRRDAEAYAADCARRWRDDFWADHGRCYGAARRGGYECTRDDWDGLWEIQVYGCDDSECRHEDDTLVDA